MKPDLLVVATHKNWIADEFAETGYIEVKHSLGFSAPLIPIDKCVAWWMPTETAARFALAGVNLNLSTIDAEWLCRVPEDLTGRNFWVGSIQKAVDENLIDFGYCKPAEVKISDAPAQWIEADYFVSELLGLGVPVQTKIQVCDSLLSIKYEYRCFVNKGVVTTIATYLSQGVTFGQDEFSRNFTGEVLAQKFASHVVSIMKDDQPSSYTLDIAELENGDLVVMEANPVWASNPYDCDKIEVVKAVIEGSATFGSSLTHGKFQWEPEAYLTWYALRKPVLQLDA